MSYDKNVSLINISLRSAKIKLFNISYYHHYLCLFKNSNYFVDDDMDYVSDLLTANDRLKVRITNSVNLFSLLRISRMYKDKSLRCFNNKYKFEGVVRLW